MNNLSGTYCFSHRSFSTTKLPLRKSICSRKSYPYLKQVIFFIFLEIFLFLVVKRNEDCEHYGKRP